MILSAFTVHSRKPFSSNAKGEKPPFPLSSPNSSQILPEPDPSLHHEPRMGMGQPGCRVATVSAQRALWWPSTRTDGRLCPRSLTQAGLISTAANPAELLQRQGARRSPWRFPFFFFFVLHRCKNLTSILEIHLYLSFQVESSVVLAWEHQPINPGWGFFAPY